MAMVKKCEKEVANIIDVLRHVDGEDGDDSESDAADDLARARRALQRSEAEVMRLRGELREEAGRADEGERRLEGARGDIAALQRESEGTAQELAETIKANTAVRCQYNHIWSTIFSELAHPYIRASILRSLKSQISTPNSQISRYSFTVLNSTT